MSFYLFGIQDTDEAALPSLFPDGAASGDLVTALPGRLDITTGVHTQYVTLHVQCWSGDPGAPEEGVWDAVASGTLAVPSGEMAVWEMMGRTPDTFRLPQGAGAYRLDARCSGREQARALSRQKATRIPREVEEITLRFWPESDIDATA
ncbi:MULTISPECIES: hypothetical protein [unclassified Streptomyces]|uniref:hypothetical protein n=1 Tax=unclassified Streptomyces TaxID=2593676 RepID=UPI002E2C8065|nr:hypothetical protein [Streptomyces sp. NBC_00228]